MFLEALKIHGKDWDKIAEHVGTRDKAHIRSHSQKFFKRVTQQIKGENTDNNDLIEDVELYYNILKFKAPSKFGEKKYDLLKGTIDGDIDIYLKKMPEKFVKKKFAVEKVT